MTFGEGYGLHAGIVNSLSGVFNVPIGPVNWADSAEAFQVGLFNGAYG